MGSYLVDVLALKLGDQGLEAVLVSLNANGLKDGLDIGGRGGGVATQAEEEVRSEVLHFGGLLGSRDCLVSRACFESRISLLAIASSRVGRVGDGRGVWSGVLT